MRNRWIALIGAVALVATGGAATAKVATSSVSSVSSVSAPMVAGTSSYVGGQFVWTDYAYDDHGKNTNPARRGGGTSYPAAPYPGDTADLVRGQLGETQAGALQVSVTINSIVKGSPGLIGIGFDTDQKASTGAVSLPGGELGSTSQPLGLEKLLMLPTDGGPGTLYSWNGTQLTPQGSFPVGLDLATNELSAVVSAFRPGAATWNTYIVAGILDSTGGSWATGADPIMDLAFNKEGPPSLDAVEEVLAELPDLVAWQDQNQADILAGTLPPTPAMAPVTFGSSRTALAQTPAPGVYTFVYRSSAKLGGGEPVQSDSGVFNGMYQPYLVQMTGPAVAGSPAILYLHGTGGNHLSNFYMFQPYATPPTDPTTSNYDLTRLSPVVIYAMGRSLAGWSDGPGQLDALESMRDAIGRLDLDPDRIVLTGNSAGGLGTYNIAPRYPDLFSGAYSIVGSGTTNLENLTDLPFRAHNGVEDPLFPVPTYLTQASALDAVGTVDYRLAENFQRNHSTSPLGTCWYEDLLTHPRMINPGRVRFTLPTPLTVDATTTLRPDSAYWVSGLNSRSGGTGSVDATSMALPQRGVTSVIDAVQDNYTAGRDYCGPNPNYSTHEQWRLTGRTFGPIPTVKSNSVVLTLSGLSGATFDTTRMSLNTGELMTLKVTGDGTSTLTLVGRWTGAVQVLRDSIPVGTVKPQNGQIVVAQDFTGTHTITLRPVGVSG